MMPDPPPRLYRVFVLIGDSSTQCDYSRPRAPPTTPEHATFPTGVLHRIYNRTFLEHFDAPARSPATGFAR